MQRTTRGEERMSEREERRSEADSIDGRLERAKDAALGQHHGKPSLGDEIGEATGAIAEAAEQLTTEDDAHFRAHYEASPHRLTDREYEDVRAAYMLGHIASHN